MDGPLQDDAEYRVKTGVFEGPLDLLLYLVKKDELDIGDIPIESVASQYIAYLETMRRLDLDVAGEFLVMAATLMWIKSRALLPEDSRGEDDEEEEDPRWELVRQLVEYKKFKDTARALEGLEERRDGVFAREGADPELGAAEPEWALKDVGLFDLVRAFGDALKRAGDAAPGEIFAERWTVAEKLADLGERVGREGRLRLSSLLASMTSRQEIVCVFLALLELVRLGRARAVQAEPHGEIEVYAPPAAPTLPVPEAADA
ncbi:MAG: segregation/condensation protein A [Kiritimatiellae bacterium]|nr:segregation/condensation protein A [Kiritimatiellia bacterium]